MTAYVPRVDVGSVRAIDVHVHVEKDDHGHLSLDDELMDASAAYFDLGRAYEKNGELDRALAAYVKATELNPQSAAAFSTRNRSKGVIAQPPLSTFRNPCG